MGYQRRVHGVQTPLSTMQGGLVCLLLLLCVLLQHSASKSLDSGAECTGPPGCPHVCFEQKHHCAHCTTEEDAEWFSSGRETYTKLNTVYGQIGAFEQRNDGHDQNGNPWTEPRCVD